MGLRRTGVRKSKFALLGMMVFGEHCLALVLGIGSCESH